MYQHGRRTKQPRNMAVFLATIAIVGVVVLIGWYIVHKDIASGSDPKTTVPIVTEVSADSGGDKKEFSENYFTFKLPADWKLLEHKTGNSINAYIYASTKKGADDRRLMIHVDVMPQAYKLVKLQPVRPNGSKFLLGNLSDDCVNFAGEVDRQSNAPFQAKWENVTFMCDPITANQTIGTGSIDYGIGTPLSGSSGTHKFFFFYEDHNIHPDDKILTDAISSFQAR